MLDDNNPGKIEDQSRDGPRRGLGRTATSSGTPGGCHCTFLASARQAPPLSCEYTVRRGQQWLAAGPNKLPVLICRSRLRSENAEPPVHMVGHVPKPGGILTHVGGRAPLFASEVGGAGRGRRRHQLNWQLQAPANPKWPLGAPSGSARRAAKQGLTTGGERRELDESQARTEYLSINLEGRGKFFFVKFHSSPSRKRVRKVR